MLTFAVAMIPVLLVDDSREDLTLAERALRDSGMVNPVTKFSDGEKCIDYFSAEGASPALVLLDLMMAPTSGLAVLRATREMPAAKRSVFVMLSGASDLKMLREGYQLGARTFLIKPLTQEEALELLGSAEGVIRKVRTANGYELHWVSEHPDNFGTEARKKRTGRVAIAEE